MFALDSVDTVEKWYFFLLSSNTEDSSVLPPLPFLLQMRIPFQNIRMINPEEDRNQRGGEICHSYKITSRASAANLLGTAQHTFYLDLLLLHTSQDLF